MRRFKRTPLTLFARCGMLLYGDQYIEQLSEALGVADRSAQRWSSGARDIPPDIWMRMLTLLRTEKALLLLAENDVEQLLRETAA